MTTRLAILLSQDGYLLQTLLEAIRARYLEAEIGVVVTNQAEVAWAPRVQKAKLPIVYHRLAAYRATGRDREDYDADLAVLIEKHQPDWVVLAGWTHVLSDAFLQHFPYRVVNLHLAPPGKFPGAHAIEEAWSAFERGEIKQTGVTVHFVSDERVNRGTTLATQDVPIYRSDTLGMLTQRVRRAGCELLVNALRRLIQGDDD
jgi:phosphoribosylglycinamide formyltransferase-1